MLVNPATNKSRYFLSIGCLCTMVSNIAIKILHDHLSSRRTSPVTWHLSHGDPFFFGFAKDTSYRLLNN